MRTSAKIKKIGIRAFRGIPDLDLEIDTKSLVLLGENGTGKSSIVEAIEFFFTGSVSSLEGVRGLSLQRHGPHVNFEPDDVNVELTFKPRNVSLNRTFTTNPSPPTQLENYFNVTQKGTFILRRSQILAVIVSRPADRFKAIGSIIGVEPLDDVELEMKRLCDELAGKIESKSEEIQEVLEGLSDIMGKEIRDPTDILPAFNEWLQNAELPTVRSLEEVDEYIERIFRVRGESSDGLSALTEILESTSEPFISEESIKELKEFNQRIIQLLKKGVEEKLSVASLIRNGRDLIAQGEMENCPLCRQPIERDELLAEIDARLQIFRALSDKASEIRKDSVPLVEALKRRTEELDSIIRRIEQFGELSEKKNQLQKANASLNEFRDKVASTKDLKTKIPIEEIVKLRDEINGILAVISRKCRKLLRKEGLTEREQKTVNAIRFIEQVTSKKQALSTSIDKLSIIKQQHTIAEEIYTIFSNTKKEKIQEKYNAIQGDIQRYYSMIHPNEPHKCIELMVAPGRRASTELRMESFGRSGEDPRALTSEGHIDSLGLCIFLAFVNKFNEECSLIVLDDVVTTVDARHRGRLCKILLEEFKDKQLVITTHDEIWYEQLRASQRAHGLDGHFRNLVIVDWNVDMGPIIRPYKPRWKRIQDKIEAGDRSGAGNEGRRYLEWLLEEICINTEASVPLRKDQRYTIDELRIAAKKRLEHLLKEGEFKERIFQVLQDLEATIIMGNLLSHNNILAQRVSIVEVQVFCNAVYKLHESLSCPNCQNLLLYHRDQEILCCSNSRCSNPLRIHTN